ncbi:septal ring factor EnvC (AmiA/AmiB activator) [Yoonia maricola]|uniref:Septal ring factor EnvC (AmiA/AmiB activator) n=1 Tax=Yoonia maricola TaxID=420999 RepID=A0A2M8WQ56_9RHOB|nr:peptidoglycan DD-metalloendopeptidase family protein [Yoonia maricola]PJI93069.1 septal ring factor EnvC (AmiA/AmiB activator) [Yoonia maricola]
MIRLSVFLICFATGLLAQQTAQEAAAQLQSARMQLEAADGARDRIAALTQTVQAYEAGLAAMRAEQRDIALREGILTEELELRTAEFAQLLGVLSAISRTPQPVLRTHPDGPLDTVRAGMLVADVTPGLEAEVARLDELLAETRRVRAAQDAAAQTLQDGLQGAQTARAALGQAVSERSDLPTRFSDDPVQTALLVASAETLDDFATQITAARPESPETLSPQGNLPLPVGGTVLPDDNSGRPGIRIAAAPRALVTAPAPATILFQGPLLNYGTVVILEPAADVMFVLAGFAEVFGQPGQVLPMGAPIGLLGDTNGLDDGILTDNLGNAAGQSLQALYLEVREGQTPVNPDAWFAVE